MSLCLSLRLSGTSLSKGLNLHLSFIGLSQNCPRSVSGQSQGTAYDFASNVAVFASKYSRLIFSDSAASV